jgi:hypothetical protein
MSVIENLAFRESEQTPPLAQMRERIDGAEAIVDNLCIEATNEIRVFDDQLKRVADCSRQMAHAWLAYSDNCAANYFELMRGLARARGIDEVTAAQLQFGKAQAAASGDHLRQCCDLSSATAAECSREK